jgi:hypothetical protein
MANKAVKVFLRNGDVQLIHLDELDNLDFDFPKPTTITRIVIDDGFDETDDEPANQIPTDGDG